MPTINLVTDLEQSGFTTPTDLAAALHYIGDLDIGRMPRGTSSGKSTVMIRFELPTGQVVILETTEALFHAAAVGIRAADERDAAVADSEGGDHD